jgi:tRNA dimethylallyltransferase
MYKPLIVLLGPTAVGKTELSLRFCERFHGEVVSADSRQIYRHMDIGTAKPALAEQQRVRHHLIDLREPDQVLSLAEYQQLAYAAIDAIHQRQRIPFLVGGTALYVRAVVSGLRIPEAPPNPALRAQLEVQLAETGVETLFARLQALDPAGAAVIDRRNPRRVMRALEIVLTTGRSKLELEGAEAPPYRILQCGLQRERASLYQRIDQRVDEMIAQGLAAETQHLLALGYAANLPAMTSLGYREMTAYLRGEMSLDEATTRIKTETHRFVRHQLTWFRKLPAIEWFDADHLPLSALEQRIADFLRSDSPPAQRA